jgi:predicted DNA-binding transcriptional regulator AlpA
MTNTSEKYLTEREVCRLTKLSKDALRMQTRHGTFPPEYWLSLEANPELVGPPHFKRAEDGSLEGEAYLSAWRENEVKEWLARKSA